MEVIVGILVTTNRVITSVHAGYYCLSALYSTPYIMISYIEYLCKNRLAGKYARSSNWCHGIANTYLHRFSGSAGCE